VGRRRRGRQYEERAKMEKERWLKEFWEYIAKGLVEEEHRKFKAIAKYLAEKYSLNPDKVYEDIKEANIEYILRRIR